jgi:hypothetical protein
MLACMPKAKSSRSAGASKGRTSRSVRGSLTSIALKVFCFTAAIFAIVQAWKLSERLACIDFYQFWTAGQVVRETQSEDIYATAERQRLGKLMLERAEVEAGSSPQAKATSKRFQSARSRDVLETYSTPWLYTVFALASGGNYDKDQDRYLHFSLLCLVFGVAAISTILDFTPAAGAIAVAVLVTWFFPAKSEMFVGNVNRVQLALLAFFLLIQSRESWRWRHAAGGFALGSAVVFKPNLGFVALTLTLGWAVFKRYRKLLLESAGMVLGGLFSVAASAWYFRSFRPWLSWARELSRLMSEYDMSVSRGNFSLARLVRDSVGEGVTSLFPILFFGVVVFVLVRSMLKAGASSVQSDGCLDAKWDLHWDVLLVSLGASVSLLAVQLAWLHYFVLTIPAVLYLLRPTASTEGTASARRVILRVIAVAGGIMVAMDPQALFQWDTSDYESALLVSGGTLILFALAVLDRPPIPQGNPS